MLCVFPYTHLVCHGIRTPTGYSSFHFLIWISHPQPLDFETKSTYTLKVEVTNRYIDPHFLTYGPFSDTTTVKLTVEDINEPPIFTTPLSKMVVSEAAKVGTIIGSVSARDPDDTNSGIR